MKKKKEGENYDAERRVLNEEKEKEATGKRLSVVDAYVCARLTRRKRSKSISI
jgi:hypothetical protein